MGLESAAGQNRAESLRSRCEKTVNSYLLGIEKRYSSQALNEALQYLFVPTSTDATPPELATIINERMHSIAVEFGDEAVNSALHSFDRNRFPPAPLAEDPKPDDQEIKASEAIIQEMSEIYRELAEKHTDAYELLGGDDAYYHLDEMPVHGSVEQTADLQQKLQQLKLAAATAADYSLPEEERKAKLKELSKQL